MRAAHGWVHSARCSTRLNPGAPFMRAAHGWGPFRPMLKLPEPGCPIHARSAWVGSIPPTGPYTSVRPPAFLAARRTRLFTLRARAFISTPIAKPANQTCSWSFIADLRSYASAGSIPPLAPHFTHKLRSHAYTLRASRPSTCPGGPPKRCQAPIPFKSA